MYATAADMIRQFTRREVLALTDPEDTGDIDQDILDGALRAASAEIDTYLGGRYRLPLSPAPQHLVRVCCDITRYVLTGDERQDTDTINDRYRAAVRFLELVSSGKVTLGPADNGVTPSADGSVQFVQGMRVFGRQGPGVY